MKAAVLFLGGPSDVRAPDDPAGFTTRLEGHRNYLSNGLAKLACALAITNNGGPDFTTNVVQGPWVNLGPPTTNTSLTVPATNPAGFFRLQSLPNGL